ncbi:hypothetical protein CURTO8I2_220045 [Curtobacterium sp. 8I-2]|nr:hypothetical protein CURTO8I2_220045 [Curtobacterium sp. 8I-2]
MSQSWKLLWDCPVQTSPGRPENGSGSHHRMRLFEDCGPRMSLALPEVTILCASCFGPWASTLQHKREAYPVLTPNRRCSRGKHRRIALDRAKFTIRASGETARARQSATLAPSMAAGSSVQLGYFWPRARPRSGGRAADLPLASSCLSSTVSATDDSTPESGRRDG